MMVMGGVAAAITLAMAGGAWALGYQPNFAEIDAARSAARADEQAIVAVKAELTELSQQAANMGNLYSELSKLRQALPIALDEAAVTRELASIAAQTETVIRNVTVSTPMPVTSGTEIPLADGGALALEEPPTGLYALGFTLDVTGEELKVVDFLTKVQASPNLTTQVTGATWSGLSPADEGEAQPSMSMEGSIYVYVPGGSPAQRQAAAEAAAAAGQAAATDGSADGSEVG
jgi:hypothetical protein